MWRSDKVKIKVTFRVWQILSGRKYVLYAIHLLEIYLFGCHKNRIWGRRDFRLSHRSFLLLILTQSTCNPPPLQHSLHIYHVEYRHKSQVLYSNGEGGGYWNSESAKNLPEWFKRGIFSFLHFGKRRSWPEVYRADVYSNMQDRPYYFVIRWWRFRHPGTAT